MNVLIPRRCDDGFTRWLERIRVFECYRRSVMDWGEWQVDHAYPLGVESGVIAT